MCAAAGCPYGKPGKHSLWCQELSWILCCLCDLRLAFALISDKLWAMLIGMVAKERVYQHRWCACCMGLLIQKRIIQQTSTVAVNLPIMQ